MNYIELLNNYWSLREQGILDRNAGDLYLYLIHKSNSLGWKNPFNQSNALICGFLSINEKTLIANRNKLKQEGLVEFVSGKKGLNTEYTLLAVRKGGQNYRESYRESGSDNKNTGQNYSEKGSESDSLNGRENDSLAGEKSADNTKHKLNKTKQNDGDGSAAIVAGSDSFANHLEELPPPGPPAPPSAAQLFVNIEDLSTTCQHDSAFYEPLCMQHHFSRERLAAWLEAFNRQLSFESVTRKLPRDYRKHFSNWIRYQDITKNPADYSPIQTGDYGNDQYKKNQRPTTPVGAVIQGEKCYGPL